MRLKSDPEYHGHRMCSYRGRVLNGNYVSSRNLKACLASSKDISASARAATSRVSASRQSHQTHLEESEGQEERSNAV